MVARCYGWRVVIVPHDVGAERAILGAVLLRPDTLHHAEAAGIERSALYSEAHRLIWEVLREADEAGHVDIVTVAGALERRGKLDAVGGYSYLAGLSAATPTLSGVERYIEVVLSLSRARSLLVAMAEAQGRLADGDDADEVAAVLQSTITEGAAMSSTASLEADSVGEVYAELREGRRGAEVLPTGLRELDEAIEGLLVGDVTVITGDTGSGKSALADQIAMHLAVEHRVPGGYFAFEMTRKQMSERRLARLASVPYGFIRRRDIRSTQLPHIAKAYQQLSEAPVVTDEAMYTAPQWLAKVRAGVARYGWRWVVLDHAHLVPASDVGQSPDQRIAEVAESAKRAAKLGVAVVVVAQMNAQVRRRPDKRPERGDVKYGGALEQIATTILGVYRPAQYADDSDKKPGADAHAELIPAKTRFATGRTVGVRWAGDYQRFDSLFNDGGWE